MQTFGFFFKLMIFEPCMEAFRANFPPRKMFFLALLFFAPAVNGVAQSADPLQRAITAIGGEAALARAASVSVFMLGTQNRTAVDQSYFAGKPVSQRQQETLIVDQPSRRAVLRAEGTNSDGTPTIWRYTTLGEVGYDLNAKTGRIIRVNKEQTAITYEGLRWRIPQLALVDMKRRRDKLRCGESRTVGRQVYDLCRFETETGKAFSVLFSRQTGQLTSYEYTAPTMHGPKLMRYEFKPYVNSGVGLFPAGYRFTVGGETYKDLDLIDAAAAVLEKHPWLEPPPPESRPVSTIGTFPPASTEEVAPGVWFVRNVAGYNTMFARVGDCVAVFDAPASYGRFGEPVPRGETQPDRSAMIMDKVRETTGKKVCYVIPTHHHNDHLGGIAGFARAGATVITSQPGEMATRSVLKGAGLSVAPKIRPVREKMTLGSGDERIDIWAIKDDPHAETMLFIHLPGRRLAFEGDLSDYIPSARNLRRFIGQKGLAIERIFCVHSAHPQELDNLVWEEPSN